MKKLLVLVASIAFFGIQSQADAKKHCIKFVPKVELKCPRVEHKFCALVGPGCAETKKVCVAGKVTCAQKKKAHGKFYCKKPHLACTKRLSVCTKPKVKCTKHVKVKWFKINACTLSLKWTKKCFNLPF